MRRTLLVLTTSLALMGAVPAAAHAAPAGADRAGSSATATASTATTVRTASRRPATRPRVVTVTNDAAFVTPTAGIACDLSTSRVRGRTFVECDMLAPHAWHLPTPKSCPPEHIQGMSLSRRASTARACVDDTFAPATALGSPVTSWFTPARGVVVRMEKNRLAGLRYGYALRLGDITCTSAATGVTCTNTTGHGSSCPGSTTAPGEAGRRSGSANVRAG